MRDLSKRVGRLHEYEIFYSASSEKMHASEYKSHVQFGNGQVTLEPIRNLKSINTLLNFSLSVAFHTYQKVLGRYRPGQLKEFAQRYLECWRDSFLNIKSVNYKASQPSDPVL